MLSDQRPANYGAAKDRRLHGGYRVVVWSLGMLAVASGVAHAGFDTILNVPPGAAPAAIGSNTQLNLSSGGFVGEFFDAGAADGSSTNVEMNIAGGSVGLGFDAHGGSSINITGGVVGDIFRSLAGSAIRIAGGDYRLDGEPISGLTTVGAMLSADMPEDSVLSGTLADGTPFAFSTLDGDMFATETISFEVTALPAIGPSSITVPGAAAPRGIRAGQTVVLEAGGALGSHFSAGAGSIVMVHGGQVGANFEAVGANVSISGGVVGDRFDALVDSHVTITGGSVGGLFDATAGSEVNIFGGSVGGNLDAFEGSTITIAGGNVGERLRAFDGSVINLEGGSLGPMLDAFSGSQINISGGSLGGDVDILPGSSVHIFGTEFFLDGVAIADLGIGESTTVTNRNVTLSGTLADGSPLSLGLDTSNTPGEDFFAAAATLTVSRVAARVAGDYNNDGAVNAADYVVWRNHEGTSADLPNDPLGGTIGAAHYDQWRDNFGQLSVGTFLTDAIGLGHNVVPEPIAALLFVLGMLPIVAGSARRDR